MPGGYVHERIFAVPDQAEVYLQLLHIDNLLQCHRLHRSQINNRLWQPFQVHLCSHVHALPAAILD